MRIVTTIHTPWTPYAVTFAHDGSRVAIGGGAFFGDGGLLLRNLSSGDATLVVREELPRDDPNGWYPAVSGLCFSASDRLLAASTWVGRHEWNPTLLFAVDNLALTHCATLSAESSDGRGPSTGVLLHRDRIIIRNNSDGPAEAVDVHSWPHGVRGGPGTPLPHLTHSGLAAVRDDAITGGWFPFVPPASATEADVCRLANGLVVSTLTRQGREVRTVPVPQCRRVTAIQSMPAGNGFVTGGMDGQIDVWEWAGVWQRTRLREPREHRIDGTRAAGCYSNHGVVGICFLADEEHWVTVDGSANLCLWAGRECLWSQEIPVPGTPRSLAVHPATGHVAIGMKQGGWGFPIGCVVIVDVHRPDVTPSG